MKSFHLKNKLWMPALFLSAFFIDASVNVSQAECHFSKLSDKINIPGIMPLEIKIQRDTPVGTVIYNYADNAGGAATAVVCAGYMNMSTGYSQLTESEQVPGMNGVYRTSNPGIGFRAWHEDRLLGPKRDLPGYALAYEWFYPSFRYQLVVIGPVDDTPINLNKFHIGYWYGGLLVSDVAFRDTNIALQSRSCEVDIGSKNLIVDMGVATPADVARRNTIVNKKPFNIMLNCIEGTNINMKFNAVSQSGDKSIIQLDNSEDEGIAKGVGLQLIYQGAPVVLDQYMRVVTNSDKVVNVPFDAQYVQTGVVSAGEANATVTFDLIYF